MGESSQIAAPGVAPGALEHVVDGFADQAAVLSARLGKVDRAWLAGLRGHALILGLDTRLDDTDVPAGVVFAAWQAGLLADTPGAW